MSYSTDQPFDPSQWDVVDGFDEGDAVPDQVVAAVGERIVDGTGHGHHLAGVVTLTDILPSLFPRGVESA